MLWDGFLEHLYYSVFGSKNMMMNLGIPENKDTYTKDEVFEILRQVMFTGTPELYDQGGMYKNINLPPNHTITRAKKAFEKYYLKNVTPGRSK